MVHVRKAEPGGDSFGHQWPEAGSVVEMPPYEALVLVAIKGGGFSIVEDEPAKPAKKTAASDDDPSGDPPDGDGGDSEGADEEVTEPAPAAKVTEPAPRGRGGGRRKTAVSE